VNEYTDEDLDESFEVAADHVDFYESEEARDAYITALTTYDMHLRDGTVPSKLMAVHHSDE